MAANRRIIGGVCGLLMIGLSTLVGHSGSAASSFSFALIGDLPYKLAEVDNMGALMSDINNDSGVQFVAHVGDIKPGLVACSNSVLRGRFDLFQGFEDPFWLTPGDNDWTGCWRAGEPPYPSPYDPQERLTKLRSIFYPVPTRTTGGTTMAVTPQSATSGFAKYVENVRFRRECVTFGSVHQVGSLNGLQTVPGETTAQRNAREAEVADRNVANVAWIDRIFDSAENAGSAGVLILMHSRPSTGEGTKPVHDELIARATAFGKPVLLANGSEHVYTVTPNFLGVPNMTQWITTGDEGATDSWMKVSVDCSQTDVDQMFTHTIVTTGTTPTTTSTTVAPLPGLNGPATVDALPERGDSIKIP